MTEKRMMQSIWPKPVGEDTVAMEDVWDPTDEEILADWRAGRLRVVYEEEDG